MKILFFICKNVKKSLSLEKYLCYNIYVDVKKGEEHYEICLHV